MQVLQVREKLSTVSQSISEIEMKMFSLSAQSKSEFLLAVSTIIKQLEYLVFNNFVNDKIVIDVSNDSMKWDNIYDYPEYCDESSSMSSSFFEAPFMSSITDEAPVYIVQICWTYSKPNVELFPQFYETTYDQGWNFGTPKFCNNLKIPKFGCFEVNLVVFVFKDQHFGKIWYSL